MRVVPAMAVMVLLFAVAMAGDENPYDVLGVARDATEADIKSRFHKMALHFHPDRNKKPNAAEDFIRVAAAYELLKDPERRRTFDESAAGWKTGSYPTSFAEKFDSEAFYKTFDVLLAKHFETVKKHAEAVQAKMDPAAAAAHKEHMRAHISTHEQALRAMRKMQLPPGQLDVAELFEDHHESVRDLIEKDIDAF